MTVTGRRAADLAKVPPAVATARAVRAAAAASAVAPLRR